MHVVLELPNGGQLWLGGITASGQVDVLIANGIGCILAAAAHSPVVRDSRIEFMGNLDGTGVAHGDIDKGIVIRMLERALKLLSSGQKILVSCKNGAHRSTFLAALLIIFVTGESASVVYSHLASLRAIVDLSSTAPESKHSHGRKNLRPIDCLVKMEQYYSEEGLRSLTRLSKPAQLALGFDGSTVQRPRLNQLMTPAEFQNLAVSLGWTRPAEAVVRKLKMKSSYILLSGGCLYKL